MTGEPSAHGDVRMAVQRSTSRIITRAGDKTSTVTPIDVMTFDDDGLITSMRAYWGESDTVVR